LLGSAPAQASLARAVKVEELVARSRHVVLAEPLDAESVWEQVGQRRHIVTYTRLRALEVFAGADPKQDELMVRTLGGRVGDVGELVHGEAILTLGTRGVVFVMPASNTLAVTAMAQGHYPLGRDKAGIERLRRSPQASEVVSTAGSALERLTGLDVSGARSVLQRAVMK